MFPQTPGARAAAFPTTSPSTSVLAPKPCEIILIESKIRAFGLKRYSEGGTRRIDPYRLIGLRCEPHALSGIGRNVLRDVQVEMQRAQTPRTIAGTPLGHCQRDESISLPRIQQFNTLTN